MYPFRYEVELLITGTVYFQVVRLLIQCVPLSVVHKNVITKPLQVFLGSKFNVFFLLSCSELAVVCTPECHGGPLCLSSVGLYL